MASCYVCKRSRNSVNREKGFSFHRFPKVEVVRQQWMNFVELSGGEITNVKPGSVLCSAHFENDSFFSYVGSKILKENSIPTIVINRQKWAKNNVPEISFNLLENRVEDTERPRSIPVIANDLEVFEKGACALPEIENFPTSTDVSNSDFSLSTQKPKDESSFKMENIIQPDADDTPTKSYLKRMVEYLKTENSQEKKKIKLMKQQLRRQKQTILSLKSVVKELKDKLLVHADQSVMIENHVGMNPKSVGALNINESKESQEPDITFIENYESSIDSIDEKKSDSKIEEEGLLEQDFLLDPSCTIGQVATDYRIDILDFVRY